MALLNVILIQSDLVMLRSLILTLIQKGIDTSSAYMVKIYIFICFYISQWPAKIGGQIYSNQPPSVAPRSGATRELVALRQEGVCSVLFTPIHLQIRIDNFFGIVEFRYLYGVDTGNQSRSN